MWINKDITKEKYDPISSEEIKIKENFWVVYLAILRNLSVKMKWILQFLKWGLATPVPYLLRDESIIHIIKYLLEPKRKTI